MEEDIAGVLGLRDASAGEPPMGEDSSASAGIAVGVLRVRSSSSPKMQPGLNATGSPMHWNAFSFSPVSLPGFSDYQTTYSHFRILKAKLFISRTIGDNDGSLYNYLVVGSRPFAATNSGTYATNASLMPSQPEDALRQTKWQKIHYPNTTTQRVSAGFYPYTLIGTYGPPAVGTNQSWYRIWEAKKWMPFKWALDTGATGGNQYQALTFYGPFMVVDTNQGEISGTATVQCTLQVHVQFKGQR